MTMLAQFIVAIAITIAPQDTAPPTDPGRIISGSDTTAAGDFVMPPRPAVEFPADMPVLVRAVLERSLDAVGGIDPITKLKSIQYTLTTVASSGRVTIDVKCGPDRELLIRQRFADLEVATEKGFDGKTSWNYDPNLREWRVVPESFVRRHEIMRFVPDVFSPIMTMPGLAWEIRTPETFDGTPCEVVRIHRTAGKWNEILISTANHMPVAMRTFDPNTESINEIVRWTQWLQVGGTAGFFLPTRITATRGSDIREYVYTDVAVDTLTKTDFEPPIQIRELIQSRRQRPTP
ncbi:MAG: hypothetical protein O2800_04970 [Planctomycetota bacterium]|nr:hypothetical protein [Planctomycetota bacterium]